MTVRIIVADDHPVTRKGLSSVLENIESFQVVAETGDGRSTVEAALSLSPDVIIMDISMPDMNGLEATRAICRENDRIKIIALSIHSNKHYVREMFAAGATGYLLKNCDIDEVIKAINVVSEGEMYLCTALTSTVLQDYVKRSTNVSSSTMLELLTPREKEILLFLARGFATKEIASQLSISRKTVETHKARTMEKLGLYSIAELARFAEREGLLAASSSSLNSRKSL